MRSMWPKPCPLIKYKSADISRPRTLFSSKTAKKAAEPHRQQETPNVGITEENQYELLDQVVCPLAKMDYNDQLKLKRDWCREIVKGIKGKSGGSVKTFIYSTVASPILEHYRNKDEFSIGHGVDGHRKTVGFYVGSLSRNAVCVRGTHLKLLRGSHVAVAQAYEDFIRKSPLNPCLDFRDGGFWRNIIVRSNMKGDVMATIIAHPRGASPDDIDGIKQELREYWRTSGINLTSLYFQLCPHTRCTSDQSPFELLYGEPYIYERLGNFEFRISPDSFFQINVPCAELLYQNVLECALPTRRTTLLDLCCGTGTISILASERTRGCVGIEVNPLAVKDASVNASNNLVNNCSFFVGRIEKCLPKILNTFDSSPDVIAVINPGRGGVDKKAIKTLRQLPQITRVVYVSCKADNPNTMRNLQDLSSVKFDSSPAFYMTSVKPVDMFPHTNHYEVVFVFQR